jgi:putative ABC transport system substrate-binding protein
MSLHRRAITAALGGLVTLPWPSLAQKRGVVYRIGIIGLSPTAEIEGPKPRSPQAAMLLRALREMGYVYGQHYVTLAHGVTGNPLRMEGLVAELVRQKPDVIVATGAAVAPLKQATSTIPIVMTASLDPVGAGLVPNLVRPGGNLTGLSLQAAESTPKRLELLKELLPGPAPVAVIWNQSSLQSWQAAQTAARQRGWRLASLEIDDSGGWEAAFQAAASSRASGLLVLAAQILFPRAKAVAELANKLKLPAMYELRPYVDAGGLMCYGPDIVDIWRRAAGFVDKILDGAKPGDIPVEQPTRFEFVVNLRVARELKLTFPQRLLVRADEVLS